MFKGLKSEVQVREMLGIYGEELAKVLKGPIVDSRERRRLELCLRQLEWVLDG